MPQTGAEASSRLEKAPHGKVQATPDLIMKPMKQVAVTVEVEVDASHVLLIKNEMGPSDVTQVDSPPLGDKCDMPQQGAALSPVKGNEGYPLQLPRLRALLTSRKAKRACSRESPTTSEARKSKLRAQTGKKKLKCDSCEYTCTASNLLRAHLSTHKVEKEEKIYKCDLCSKVFTKNSNLKCHTRTHTGEKPFICGVCDFTCAHSNTLKDHMRRHTGEKPYTCNQCDYRCAHSSALRDHLRIHTGEKPFKCDQCEFKCAQRSNLKSHLKTHTGEKPFECAVCEYKSASKAKLIRHQKTHTA